ncbi:hypothetical protein J4H86_25250 [Spiractinospora alimapuensis]|uniref:hypothetical protein n=1 Tax=Spiractinospora alimapuensis TaxID=2820884 RepID=UPI001F2CB3CA|nr:hypothetical protein [Spiractinospora alimapuensis]QVQ52002.1 hypothetical protein J4H86_25250 [Spiractinospora alimapuensis]
MDNDRTAPDNSVYHPDDDIAPPDPQTMPRAFRVDVYTDDETDDTEPAYYGAVYPEGGVIARSCRGREIFSPLTPERFADRVGGILHWS